jgi:hypothetical protein
MEFDGLWVPSVRWPCRNLIIFPDALTDPDALKPGTGEPINWAAWRERKDVQQHLSRKPSTIELASYALF